MTIDMGQRVTSLGEGDGLPQQHTTLTAVWNLHDNYSPLVL